MLTNFNENAKLLNLLVNGKDFQNKDTNEYLYASLSQPPIKIIDKCNSDDELDYIVECPNCKSHVKYGQHIFMYSGYLYCDANPKCRDEVINKYLRGIYKNER